MIEYIKTLSDMGTLGDPAHPTGMDANVGAPGTEVKPGEKPAEKK